METTTPEAGTHVTPDVIQVFTDKVADHPGFEALLLESLADAQKLGHAELDPDLYAILDWPTDLDGYVNYLGYFSRWSPRQHKLAAWSSPETGQSQEVYDRLCHFYWLIDRPVGSDRNKIVQNIDWFKKWLVSYAEAWGSFLNKPESFNEEILQSFIDDSTNFNVSDSMIGPIDDQRPNNPSGWLTWNQFFARELNPGLRPIASPTDNTIVTAPADCTFKKAYPIGSDSSISGIALKKSHKVSNVKDLLEGSRYAESFANGTFVHYFLGPNSYHRFHTPVAGFVRECYPIRGSVFLDVHLKDKQFHAPDSSADAYEFTQARGVIIIDTTNSEYGNVGLVAVIPVGMAQVSSVNMTATADCQYLKGEEFGYFLFGGSDNILLFQEGVNPQILTNTSYRHYGTAAVKCKTLS